MPDHRHPLVGVHYPVVEGDAVLDAGDDIVPVSRREDDVYVVDHYDGSGGEPAKLLYSGAELRGLVETDSVAVIV